MKTKLQLKLLILLLLIGGGVFSQIIDYSRDTKWNIGLNMGGVYQDSDIKLERPGLGYGFTFGRAIYEQPNSFWGVDLRFRYLRGKTFGLNPNRTSLDSSDVFYNNPDFNYLDSAGSTYLNNSTDLHDYSLELVLKLHKLRERTGILFHVFGGLGITDYGTKSDLVDGNGNLYNYSILDSTASVPSSIHKDLLDRDYETSTLENSTRKITFMPSLGVGIGYQIGPSFSIGLEHRTTFTLNDMFEGYQAPGSEFVDLKSGNDLYHYTALNLRWNILKGKYVEPDESKGPDPYNPCDKPLVRFINPTNNEKFIENNISISAKVSRINSNNDVVIKVNGKSIATQYSTSTELLTANGYLVNGKNTIVLTASNSCGEVSEQRVVFYEKNVCLKPVIQISAPTNTVKINTQILRAKIIHLNGGNLEVLLNGQKIVHTYNSRSQDLTANLNLVKGNNTVLVKGNNICGDTSVSINVLLSEEPCLDPIISFITPVNGIQSQSKTVSMTAKALNVINRNSITVKVNGVIKTFSFSPTSKIISSAITLAEGNNTIEITANNVCGTDVKVINVSYKDAPCLAPVINITSPINGTNTQNNIALLKGKISNAVKSQVSVTLNGNVVASSLNNSTKQLSAQLNLVLGVNTIVVKAKNECGSVEKVVSITFEKAPCLAPVISMNTPQDGQVFNQSSTTVSATIQNLTSSNQVVISVNGNRIASSFNLSAGVLTAGVNLVKGANTITVTATNNCGSVTKTVVVSYACSAPIINVSTPANGLSTSNASLQLIGSTSNITSQNQLNVKLNGQVIPLNFNGRSATFSSVLNLRNGNNTIEIKGTNSCGIDTKVLTVVYNAPCLKPVVSVSSPVANQNFNTSNVLLTANVSNVASKSQIKVYHNGSIVNFGLTSTFNLSANINLVKGSNTILITASNACGNVEVNIPVTFDAPCPKPLVSIVAPVNKKVYDQSNISLTANVSNVTNSSQVVISLNGTIIAGSFNGNSVTATLTLIEGNNTIKVVAQNACGNDTKTINIGFKCNKPKINFINENGMSSAKTTVTTTISAKVVNVINKNQIVVKVNGITVPHNFNASTGILTITTKLKTGKNTIDVLATNSCGVDSQNLVINYKAPCISPVISIASPMNGSVLNKSALTISGSVLNVATKNQLTIKLNETLETLIYNTATKIYTSNLKLREGTNTILVLAKNECGSDSKSISVTYKKPCVKPIVNINTPLNNSTVSSGSIKLTGVVNNITSQSQAKLRVNGKDLSFGYNIASGLVSANIILKEGANTIVVSATNGCGKDTKSIIITYKKPCVAPIVNITTPINDDKISTPSVSYSAKTTNITSKSQITVFVNGKISTFTFNVTTGIVGGVVGTLLPTNNITIRVKNNCGTKESIVSFTKAAPCVNPEIIVNAPLSGSVVSDPSVIINGITRNITSQAEMTITINGTGKTYAYNLKSHIYSLSTALVEGTNTIVLTATNSCGTTTKTITVVYKKPCVSPTIVITSPVNNVKVSGTSLSYSGTATNITTKSQVEVFVNGNTVDFSFNSVTGTITGLIENILENNNLTIRVKNECGTKESIVKFTKAAPCVKPQIIVNSPSNGSVVSDPNVTINGITRNITSQAEMTIKVNGTGKTYAYNLKSHIYSLSTALVAGSNTIVLSATNSCGTTTKTIKVSYKKPCKKPVLNLSSPKNGFITKLKTVSLKVEALNIDNKNQIKVKLNGSLIDFVYNMANKQISATLINLKQGNNSLIIETTNTCGKVTSNTSFVYNMIKPKITLSYPDTTFIKMAGSGSKILGVVEGVQKQSQLTFVVNGTLFKSFSFNKIGTDKFEFSAEVKLKEGLNSVVISATNQYGNKDVETLRFNIVKEKIIIGEGKISPKKTLGEKSIPAKVNNKIPSKGLKTIERRVRK